MDLFSDLTDNSRNRGRLDAYFSVGAGAKVESPPPATAAAAPQAAALKQQMQSAPAAMSAAADDAAAAVELAQGSTCSEPIDLDVPEWDEPGSGSPAGDRRQRFGEESTPERCCSPTEDGDGGGWSDAASEGSPCCSTGALPEPPECGSAAVAGLQSQQEERERHLLPPPGCSLSADAAASVAPAAESPPELRSPTPGKAHADGSGAPQLGSQPPASSPLSGGGGEAQPALPARQPAAASPGTGGKRSSERRKSGAVSRRAPPSSPTTAGAAGGSITAGSDAGGSRGLDDDAAALALEAICPREQQAILDMIQLRAKRQQSCGVPSGASSPQQLQQQQRHVASEGCGTTGGLPPAPADEQRTPAAKAARPGQAAASGLASAQKRQRTIAGFFTPVTAQKQRA